MLNMIFLFSDFSHTDPYVGLMKNAIYTIAPEIKVIDICHDLPVFNPKASSYLIRATTQDLPEKAIILAVVDPGVGTSRNAVWLEVNGKHYIGPNNGLFASVVNNAEKVKCHKIIYNNENVSSSFHGRDVFAPFAAKLSIEDKFEYEETDKDELIGLDWPSELAEIIYFDHYGNAMTGLSAKEIAETSVIRINDHTIHFARTFGEVNTDELFWYENSLGLIELAQNQNSIKRSLSISVGDSFELIL